MSLRSIACMAVAVLALTAGCSSESPVAGTPSVKPTSSPTTAPTPAPVPGPLSGRYVAIGDSYAAGPGISPVDPDSVGCLRSTANYPSLLAAQLGTTLVDVTCSGATTTTVTQGANGLTGTVKPQLDALTQDTDLVTVGVGGNDGSLFQSLLQSCSQGASTCEQYVNGQARNILAMTTDSIDGVLEQVARRAPDADVVLVGYLRLSPETGTCQALGIEPQAQDTVRTAETDLDEALRAAAQRAGVTFVSVRAISEGHDACAGTDAWTNGATAWNGDGVIFHPRPAGMRAVASAVARVVS